MRACVLAIVVALVGATSVAHGDEVETAAQVHLDRGIDAFHAGEHERALRELTTAHELVPHKANPYRWLALVEIQIGDCASALVHIDGFLARVPPDDARIAEMTRWQVLCRTSARPVERPPAPAPTPVTRRWWFWTAIGVGAIAITGAILVTRDDGPSMLPPIRCGASGCAP